MIIFIILLILALIFAIAAVIFAIQNPALITVTFLLWEVEGTTTIVLLIAYGAGLLTMLLLLLPGIIRTRIRLAGQDKKIKDLAKSLPPEPAPQKDTAA